MAPVVNFKVDPKNPSMAAWPSSTRVVRRHRNEVEMFLPSPTSLQSPIIQQSISSVTILWG